MYDVNRYYQNQQWKGELTKNIEKLPTDEKKRVEVTY